MLINMEKYDSLRQKIIDVEINRSNKPYVNNICLDGKYYCYLYRYLLSECKLNKEYFIGRNHYGEKNNYNNCIFSVIEHTIWFQNIIFPNSILSVDNLEYFIISTRNAKWKIPFNIILRKCEKINEEQYTIIQLNKNIFIECITELEKFIFFPIRACKDSDDIYVSVTTKDSLTTENYYDFFIGYDLIYFTSWNTVGDTYISKGIEYHMKTYIESTTTINGMNHENNFMVNTYCSIESIEIISSEKIFNVSLIFNGEKLCTFNDDNFENHENEREKYREIIYDFFINGIISDSILDNFPLNYNTIKNNKCDLIELNINQDNVNPSYINISYSIRRSTDKIYLVGINLLIFENGMMRKEYIYDESFNREILFTNNKNNKYTEYYYNVRYRHQK
jgi:hypothetical protein